MAQFPVALTEGTYDVTDVLENRREAIAEACKRHGIARLEVFSSALRDDFRPGENNVDLLVELGPMERYSRVDAYFGLLEDLRAILGERVNLEPSLV